MVSDKKIALLGLDNAGKTSILTAMKKKFDIPKEVKGIKPTLKVERSNFQFLNHIIYLNDFGGQKRYVNEYLSHKTRYLSSIDLLFFVVDIQDKLRFKESYEFLNEILDYFQEIQCNAPVIILFHKSDPKLKNDPSILSNQKEYESLVRPWLEKRSIHFYNTTIYQINTIVHAFSKGIFYLYDQNTALQKLIDEYVEKMDNVMALLIFEQNGIELGSYFLDHITLSMKKKILTLYEISQRRILEENINTYEFSDRLDPFTKISGTIQSFNIEGVKFYILLILEEHDEEIVVNQFNYFENAHDEIQTILRAILLDEFEDELLNPND
ncbi:MAG: 50S ribosome-binding GTPase [Candidatus Lokiarchaeota archaeon]|nr:50S ribosome-binding GTPase [Candidatus Harpocratesius repetitus]